MVLKALVRGASCRRPHTAVYHIETFTDRNLLCRTGSFIHSLAAQISTTLNFIVLFPGLSEFPPETRHVLEIETWLLRGANLSTHNKTPPTLSPTKLSKSGGGAPGSGTSDSGAPGYVWQDVGTAIRFQNVQAQVIFSNFHKSHPAIIILVAERTTKAHTLRPA